MAIRFLWLLFLFLNLGVLNTTQIVYANQENQINNAATLEKNDNEKTQKEKRKRRKEEKIQTEEKKEEDRLEKEKKERSTITADKLKTDVGTKTISAVGNVEIIKGQKIFHAESVSYNKEKRTIKAKDRVKLKDNEFNTNIFAEQTLITDDIREGEFYNAGIIFDNGSSITSPKLTMENENYFLMENPLYSMCPTELDPNLSYEEILKETSQKKSRLFSVVAKNLSIDKENKYVMFRGATIKIWKIPIFYLPYLKTSRPFGVQQTGFISPRLESSSNYGYGVYIPYYLKINENQNLTLTPAIYTKGNMLLEANYSYEKDNSYIKIDSNLIFDNNASKKIKNIYEQTEKDEGEYQQLRGLINLGGQYNFDEKWYFKTKAHLVSDPYVLRDYKKEYNDYLQSNVELNRINNETTGYFSFNTLFFQEIKENRSNIGEQTPQNVPMIDFYLRDNRRFGENIFTYNFKGNTTFINRSTGTDYKRLTIEPSIEAKTIKYGNVFDMKLNFRGDVYFINEDLSTENKLYEDKKARFIPELELNWSFPLISKNKMLTIQPMIKYVFTPNISKIENYIPNEDSQETEISHTNIFANSRYAGYDRLEYGNRITYGFIVNFYKTDYGNLNIILAQGYRDKIKSDNGFKIKGFEDNLSDYVGGINFDNKNFELFYRFRADRENFSFQKNEFGASLKLDKLELSSSYTMNEKEEPDDIEGRQFSYGAKISFYKHWWVSYDETIDFVGRNRIIERNGSIMYDGNCVRFEITYSEDYPRDFPKRDKSINFSYAVKTSLF